MPGSLGSCALLLLAVFAIAGCGGDIVLPPPSVENVGNTIAFIPDPFVDGRILDETFSGPVPHNGGDGCPEG